MGDMRRGRILGAILSVLVAALLASGCVTTDQVDDIVRDANRDAMLASVAGPDSTLAAADDRPDAATWRQTVDRIETFIEDNPEEDATNNALRIREAVVLINAGQYNLARAAFSQVDRSMLGSVRDLAIYDARDYLIWWYGWDGSLSGDNEESARAALSGLADVAGSPDGTDGIARDAGIRRFLEEARVRIAVTLAENLPNEAEIRSVLDEAMPRYAAQFDNDDQAEMKAWCQQGIAADGSILKSLRWLSYAPTAFADADAAFGGRCAAECPTYTPGWMAGIDRESC